MEIVVSLPRELVERVNRCAEESGMSLDTLCEKALAEHLRRHRRDEITRSWDAIADAVGAEEDPFREEAVKEILRGCEW